MADSPRSLPAFGGTPTERATMSRGLAFLFAAGAALVGISLLLPHSSNTNDAGLLIAVGLAVLTAAGLLRAADRASVRGLQAVLALGTALIGVCVIYGGDSASAYPLMFVWVALYAGYVFTPRAALAESALAAAACGAAFLIENDTRAPSVHWLMGAGTILVAAVLTTSLTRRVRAQQADLATVARMANGLADLTDYAVATCASLRASAHADAVVLLEPHPGAVELGVTAVSGSAGSARLFDRERAREGLLRALHTGRPRTLEQEPRAKRSLGGWLSGNVVGHAQPIIRDGRAVGVLALGYTRPRRGVPERAATAALLFAAEVSVAMERAARVARDRERRAIDINDNIVQGLTVAKYAIGQGHLTEGLHAIDDTLRRARQLITDQLTDATAGQGGPQPGDLVREAPLELDLGT
jgi:GAF domain-containing protein